MNSQLLKSQTFIKSVPQQFGQFKNIKQKSYKVQAGQKAGTWLPGYEHPSYLDGSLPGDYGFDPLRLAENPADLQRFRVSELIHGRWAMLGVAGALAVEILGLGNWYDAPLWAKDPNGLPTYLGQTVPLNLPALALIETVAIAFVEMQRVYEQDPEKQAYPGGSFDPLGFSKGKPENYRRLQVNEVKNGRLAMLAAVGFASQHYIYNSPALKNLTDHITNPTANNFAVNGISLPQYS